MKMKIRAKKIEWREYPNGSSEGIIKGNRIVSIGYSIIARRFHIKMCDRVYSGNGFTPKIKDYDQAKQKAQEILDKFVNDIAEGIDG